MKTIDEQIDCVKFEVVFRKAIHRAMLRERPSEEGIAKYELECMEAVLETLKLIEAERQDFPDYPGDGLPLPR